MDAIPAAIKQADINLWKCAAKAVQLQNVKPIIAYWCEYWVVRQILAKQLHLADEGTLQYTTNLMDKLEETKNEYSHEEAVTDDVASQAYVEQFAQETLDRAERVVKANKVTQQTATTFDAAATFFHLVNIWGTPDAETQQKIKYAKWNAARIVKAIKEGKDPNESNPKQEELDESAPPPLDASDPEVQSLTGRSYGAGPRSATVEDVPDADLWRDAAGVSLPQSPASGGPPSAWGDELKLPGVPTQLNDPVPNSPSSPSPISPSSHNPVNHAGAPDLPSPAAGSTWAQSQPSPLETPPSVSWSQPPHQAPPAAAPPTFAMNTPSTAAVASPPVSPPTNPYYMNMAPTAHTAHPSAPATGPATSWAPAPNVAVDETAMAGAQKHAKWAISALNFEDVPTAVKELRRALELLGAT
ncbi:putative vacuolar protein sorting-associated protein [Triangularia verruculosa]|uniref:Vacuolar protein sorting-associated protein n=1 Tax=Triangularia verruculosa TaxID=2587418 RepID=A0AAN6XG38_9PEZI|nr:putative vacuolar protein sorting-associated protein [Triangularia verruculosa]